MNLNEDKLYNKMVALDLIYNFVVEVFFEIKLFRVSKKYCCKFTDFEI